MRRAGALQPPWNSTGFHAPQEGSRILGQSLDYAPLGQQTLATLWREKAGGGVPSPAPKAPPAVEQPRPIPGAPLKTVRVSRSFDAAELSSFQLVPERAALR